MGNLKLDNITGFKAKVILANPTTLGEDANPMCEAMETTIPNVAKKTLRAIPEKTSEHKETW